MTDMMIDVRGEGDPILFIHGLGGTSNVFAPQVELLRRFYRCVSPDLAGSGRTSAEGTLSIASLTDDLASIIDADGAQRWHVVAHSMGTVVAQHLALLRPDHIRSLSLIGPIAEPAQGARSALRDRAAKARAGEMAAIADQIVQGGTSDHTRASNGAAAAFVREIIMRQPAEGYARTCEALAEASAADAAQINIPALLLTGDQDGTAPPRAVQELACALPRGDVRIIGQCGHWATIEHPALITNIIQNFIMATS